MAESSFGELIYDCLDGIVFKVREDGKVINKTVYLCVGLNKEGLKEVLGMWVGKNESAAFWMGVLTDLKARGVEDILITVTDNLNGFTETIKSVFPTSTTQICVVHQIRNSCRYVVWKEKKEFTSDLKNPQRWSWRTLSKNGGLNIHMRYAHGEIIGKNSPYSLTSRLKLERSYIQRISLRI